MPPIPGTFVVNIGKGKAFVPFLCTSVASALDVYELPICSAGDGHLRPDPRDVPPGAVPSDRIKCSIFDPVFPEHRSKPPAERGSLELCVRIRLWTSELIETETVTVPPEVLGLREERGVPGGTDCGCRVLSLMAPWAHPQLFDSG